MTKDSRRLPLADWQLADSDRLKEIFQRKRAALKLTQDKLAEGLGDGVTQGAISHFMNRRTALSLKAAAVFAQLLEVPVSDISPTLAGQLKEIGLLPVGPAVNGPVGDGNASAANTPFPVAGDVDSIDERYAFIPQYTAKAAAGLGHDNPHVESAGALVFKRDWLRAKGVNPKSLIVIYADGDSMLPTICDHDVLLVDTSRIEPVDGHVFVLAAVDGAIVKRLVRTALGGWIIRSDNEDKDEYGDRVPLRADNNEHRVIGKVIWRGGDL